MSEREDKMLTGHHPEDPEDSLERELTAALRPLKMPADFTQRVLARVEGEADKPVPRRAAVLPFRARQMVGGAAIAAALVGGVFATEAAREHRERERRQAAATQQFEAATRITDQALAHTRYELDRAGVLQGD